MSDLSKPTRADRLAALDAEFDWALRSSSARSIATLSTAYDVMRIADCLEIEAQRCQGIDEDSRHPLRRNLTRVPGEKT